MFILNCNRCLITRYWVYFTLQKEKVLNKLDLQMCSHLQERKVEFLNQYGMKWQNSSGSNRQLRLSVQQICKDLSFDGVVIAAGPYLCSRTTIYLISVTFHRQHSVQGPWARKADRSTDGQTTGYSDRPKRNWPLMAPPWELRSNFVSVSLNLTPSLSLRPHCITSIISFTTKALTKAASPAQNASQGLQAADKCPKESCGC